jgi:hypothetical protein
VVHSGGFIIDVGDVQHAARAAEFLHWRHVAQGLRLRW